MLPPQGRELAERSLCTSFHHHCQIFLEKGLVLSLAGLLLQDKKGIGPVEMGKIYSFTPGYLNLPDPVTVTLASRGRITAGIKSHNDHHHMDIQRHPSACCIRLCCSLEFSRYQGSDSVWSYMVTRVSRETEKPQFELTAQHRSKASAQLLLHGNSTCRLYHVPGMAGGILALHPGG